jgi:hypothetical protein
MVDFGCVKKFSPEFIELARVFNEPDWYASKEKSHKIAGLTWGPKVANRPRVSRKLLNGLKDLHDTAFGSRAPVDFGNPNLLRKIVHLWAESIKSEAVNQEFAFYGRAEMGLYNVLHHLRAQIDTAQVLANHENPTPSAKTVQATDPAKSHPTIP